MESSLTTLVIMLSVVLLILLLLCIVIAIITIQIMLSVRRVGSKVEQTTDNLNDLLTYSGKKVIPATISALVAVFTREVTSRVKSDKSSKK